MKVKTFLGSDAKEVDTQVNDWLAESKVHVCRACTAFKRYRDKGKDALTGKNYRRYGVGVAISIWYEPIVAQAKSGWSGQVATRRAAPAKSKGLTLR